MLSDDGSDIPALVYLSGRMAGTEDHGFAKFMKAREDLRGRGYSVLCPSEASRVHASYTREDHLHRDLSMVLLADEVCVLPDWEMSKGACLEVMAAVMTGLPVWEFETGERIDHIILAEMDPRRFIMPVKFDEWREALAKDDGAEVVVEVPPSVSCGDMTIPYKGASATSCSREMGHRGKHSDGRGNEWAP